MTPKAAVFGGQPSFSLAFYPGWNEVSADISVGEGRVGRSDSVSGFGDLFPTAQLFWNRGGVHNWMAYVTGGIPVGDYDPDRLANLGLGHAAIDAGGATNWMGACSRTTSCATCSTSCAACSGWHALTRSG